MEEVILSYCRIGRGKVSVNGNTVFSEPGDSDAAAFLSVLYKKLGTSYPKFFKMDKLCKAGFLATEFLSHHTPGFPELDKTRMALVFSNRASSLESDRAHVKTIADHNNYFPSPSVFVYTLPNIVTGEIAIRHKITGENAFFVSDGFDPGLLHSYARLLFRYANTDTALCGWIDVDGNTLDVFVYCLKRGNFKWGNNDPGMAHSPEKIEQLFNA